LAVKVIEKSRIIADPMPSREQIKDWIQWFKNQQSLKLGSFPRITHVTVTGVWKQAALSEREQLLALFTEELAANPTDVATRFVALHCFLPDAEYFKEQEELILEGCQSREWLDEYRRDLLKDLAILVHLLPVSDCPAEWDFIEWEVLNSCLISDGQRVLQLIDIAEKSELKQRAEIQALRAQYRILGVVRSELSDWEAKLSGGTNLGLEGQLWEPKVYSCDKDDESNTLGILLFNIGLAEPPLKHSYSQSELELLSDAAHDLLSFA
jgi:hypothetical protein